ncbi:MAG: nuclear transport factor 2 family protein [Acidobacteriia bacterium]|nr:nuclear transport factor 2 family protein [Terriglobia bacterium]
MRSVHLAIAVLGFVVAGGPCGAAPADDRSQPRIEEIRAFEARYLKTVDDGDVNAQLELVSRDPGVYSILDGKIWRGWEAIKSQAEAYVPISKLVKNTVDGLEIAPLADDLALVVAQVHSKKVNPADASLPEMAGVMTHVLRREAGGWRMLHEHFSTTSTPELIAWQYSMLQAAKKAPPK